MERENINQKEKKQWKELGVDKTDMDQKDKEQGKNKKGKEQEKDEGLDKPNMEKKEKKQGKEQGIKKADSDLKKKGNEVGRKQVFKKEILEDNSS